MTHLLLWGPGYMLVPVHGLGLGTPYSWNNEGKVPGKVKSSAHVNCCDCALSLDQTGSTSRPGQGPSYVSVLRGPALISLMWDESQLGVGVSGKTRVSPRDLMGRSPVRVLYFLSLVSLGI